MANKRKRETELEDLPSDTLLQIITRVDHEDRLSLSLMSKLFLSLTNQFVHKLRFHECLPSSDSGFQKVFTRFSSVNRVAIRSTRIAHALTLLADSGLKIEGLELCGLGQQISIISLSGMLRLVKYLKFRCLSDVGESKVIEFISFFESLEELDLSLPPGLRDLTDYFTWNYDRIELLTMALKCRNLRRVNMNHNIHMPALSLSKFARFVNLEHISVDGCRHVALQDIWVLVLKATNLKSLEFSKMREPIYRILARIIPIGDKLSHLSIKGNFMTDDFLLAIAKLRSPLTSLEFKPNLSSSNRYTMRGVSAMLHAFQGLTRLHAYLPWPGSVTQDKDMSKLVKSLPCLKDVCLLLSSPAYATLFSLIRNCKLLDCIDIKSMDSRTRCSVPRGIRKNYSVRCIYLDPRPDACVKKALESSCPSSKIFM